MTQEKLFSVQQSVTKQNVKRRKQMRIYAQDNNNKNQNQGSGLFFLPDVKDKLIEREYY